jgi:hypothetical protein
VVETFEMLVEMLHGEGTAAVWDRRFRLSTG